VIAEMVGFAGKIVWNTDKPNGQPRRCLDTQRTEDLFGFKAKIDFRVGLRRTIDWYEQKRSALSCRPAIACKILMPRPEM